MDLNPPFIFERFQRTMDSATWVIAPQRASGMRSGETTVHPGWLFAGHKYLEPQVDSAERQAVQFATFAQLMRTAGALDRAATDILAGLGVTAGAFFALLELASCAEAGLAPSELARRLAVARRTATLYVDILLKNGWVSREAHPDDKRMILARLTPEGEELLATIGVTYKAQLGRLMDALLTVEARELHELLSRVPLEADTVRCGFLQLDDVEGA
jgi:DNA-binding MarR family transcriptional regulator